MTGYQLIGLAAFLVALIVVAVEVGNPIWLTITAVLVIVLSIVVALGGARHVLKTGYIAGRYPWGIVEYYRVESPRLFWVHVALSFSILSLMVGFGMLIVFHKMIELTY